MTGLRQRPVIGQPKTTVEKVFKIKVLNGYDSFLCDLAVKMYGYIYLVGSRKCVRSIIIWGQDSTFVFSVFFWTFS